ncbi:MAG: cysteine--1-D-myo-inosityl 2-amino-2-deoxy-alpha-D-glucopyranoside ligase [Marmoricola sp.]
MRAWPGPDVPDLTDDGAPATPVRVFSSSAREPVELVPQGPARMYVCGITPYDATHLGHAATYVAFDLLNRAWRSAGHPVRYVQNVTDVDDPLLERARETGEDWQALAERETELFRGDMAALRVLPPDAYVGAVESIPLVVDMVGALQERDSVYPVGADLYFAVHADPAFGEVSGWSRDEMMAVYADRGGDPDRAGKRDPLDCLVWRAERPGEPAWDSPFGRGRPGWHVECAAIARHHLGGVVDVQGGGSDLVFPHHEMSAAEAQAAHPGEPFARAYVHAGMVGYAGEKMSKSRGNLVLVSTLRAEGVDPMAIRLAILDHHYRTDWEWTAECVTDAEARVGTWRKALSSPAGAPAGETVAAVLGALADDLDGPRALAAAHEWAMRTLGGDTSTPGSPAMMARVLDAALGLSLV